jgi:hypothetical protein
MPETPMPETPMPETPITFESFGPFPVHGASWVCGGCFLSLEVICRDVVDQVPDIVLESMITEPLH